MAGGPQPKRVTCPLCSAPTGITCVDPQSRKPVSAHRERHDAALVWYRTKSPDGLTPERRDEMVEELGAALDRRKVGAAMERITKSADPEAQFAKEVG